MLQHAKLDREARPVRRMGAAASVALLNDLHGEADAETVLAETLAAHDPGEVALVSSFGADSAVLLHMLARIAPATPVLMLETGMLFEETLAYQRALSAALGLSDVRLIRPDPGDLEARDADGRLHRRDADACCHVRKTLPLDRALRPFAAWLTGRKRFQATSRAALAPFEVEEGTTRLKANPLFAWGPEDVRAYMDRHDLPRHPLVAQGYPSIGCRPCTTPVAEGEDARAGRWRGADKEECGIHFDGEKWVRFSGGLP